MRNSGGGGRFFQTPISMSLWDYWVTASDSNGFYHLDMWKQKRDWDPQCYLVILSYKTCCLPSPWFSIILYLICQRWTVCRLWTLLPHSITCWETRLYTLVLHLFLCTNKKRLHKIYIGKSMNEGSELWSERSKLLKYTVYNFNIMWQISYTN